MQNSASRAILLKYKGNRCSACGKGVVEMVEEYGRFQRLFEFNHVDPSLKDPNYDNLIRRRVISTEQLDELDKCVLLCDRCHNALTAQNIQGTLELVVRLGNRKASQLFKCQLIVNKKTRHITFLTADQLLAVPYRVKVGSRRPELMFGTELYANNTLGHLIKGLPETKRITIDTWHTGRRLLTAEHFSAGRYRPKAVGPLHFGADDSMCRRPRYTSYLGSKRRRTYEGWHDQFQCRCDMYRKI